MAEAMGRTTAPTPSQMPIPMSEHLITKAKHSLLRNKEECIVDRYFVCLFTCMHNLTMRPGKMHVLKIYNM